MVTHASIPRYRQLMIKQLLEKILFALPPQPIHSNSVAYHRFYHVLDTTDDYVQFTFLERVGESMYHWPRRDDINTGHLSNVFFGPVTILIFISGPFPNE